MQTTDTQNLDNQANVSVEDDATLIRSREEIEQRQEREQISELSAIDRDVRAHEAAHAAAGGSIAGSPSFSYTRSPDGRLYATGGEVSIDTSPVPGDPQATIDKAETIIRAANAPADPSPQDLRVAASAQALLVDAQAELLALEAEAKAVAEDETESIADEETSFATNSNEPSAFESNRDSIQERLERSREQREAFADQLQELNRRLNDVQQQLIDSGLIDSLNPQGNFLDLVV
ncbi:MAG: putative metalloprotease CJM1_0395 family protein [Motiliproteus sp.]|nr:putative metalloprotease CJM1_0395 family protein [Motiliproteus sp.]